jgi:hypothetical protein
VAPVLTARQTLGLAGAVAPSPAVPVVPDPPAWERLLGGMLDDQRRPQGLTRLGLLFEVRPPGARSAVAERDRQPHLALRPVVPGRTGWITTGVSWNALVHTGYGSARLEPRQRDALMRLLPSELARYGYYGQGEWLGLEALDGGWAQRLRHCRSVGIELITDRRRGGAVVVADRSACVELDLRRTRTGGIRCVPSVALPDEFDGVAEPEDDGAGRWRAVGSPPSGVWHLDHPTLRLAEFDPPVDAATARVLSHGPVAVPEPDAGRFLAAVVPRLSKRVRVGSSDDSVEVVVVARPRLLLRLTHLPGNRLALEWAFTQALGETVLVAPVGSDDHADVRDRDAETALLAGLAPWATSPHMPARAPGGYRPPAEPIVSGFDVVTFLDEVLPAVRELPEVDVEVVGDVVDYAEAVEAPTIRLSLTESERERDWFDLAVEVTVAGQQVPMADLLTALTLGHEQVILPSGTWFRLDRPELAELRRLVEEARALQDDEHGPLRLSAYHADLWSELDALGVVTEQSERWARLVKGLIAVSSCDGVEPVAAPEDLRASLRPYQLAGFSWLTFLRRHGLGGILADDMGLGKTLQALAMILQHRADAATEGGPVPPWLVVAPTSVLDTWAEQTRRFAPSLRVAVLRETTARRRSPVAAEIADADLVVTSYAVFRLDSDQFGGSGWAGLILDEAQAVKNHRSVTYSCVRTLDTPVRFAITGTPMENNLMELWSLLSIVAPGLFPNPRTFADYYRRPIENGSAPERLDTLRRRIRPVMLRRTKYLVAPDLPPKQEQVIRVDLPARHRRLYEQLLARQRQRVLGLLEDQDRNRIAILRALTVLRQHSLHPSLVQPEHAGVACAKIDSLVELLEPVLAEGHRALVFSQFTRFLTMVRSRLTDAGVAVSYLDGRTRNRQRVIEGFTSGDSGVFLISLKAGGTGLTLTEADYVFVLDPWWNPAVEAQAIDRTHRIGQDKPVNVYRLVSADTIEDKVLALQQRKRELFATVVDDGALASGELSADDIRALL